MSIQKTCRQVFAACFGLSLFVSLESKASALVPNYTNNYVVLEVVNVPSDPAQYELTAFVSDSNFAADQVAVSTYENGTYTSDSLSTRANYLFWGFQIGQAGDTPEVTLSSNAVNFGFSSSDEPNVTETQYIANSNPTGMTAYLTFDYNTFTLDAYGMGGPPTQPTPVPEPNGGLGALTLGILGASYLLSKQLKKQKSI